jgi:hypothetical protein
MLPDLSQAMSSLEVTITPTMVVIAGFVSYVLQFIKACVCGWPRLTDAIQKPLWPMVGIALCSLAFGFAHVENFLVAGAILGLAAGGGYDMFKGTTALNPTKLSV